MIGETISHYKILEKLGEGGMGVVYKAEDLKLGRTVALKFLPPEMTGDAEAKKRFIQEAQTASALDHPNICTIFEIDDADVRQMFIAMAYYEGETLRDRIEHGPLKLEEAIEITIQIAEGLSRAHESGIVHRDIKPANIMVTSRGEVRILDFGLSKLAGRTKLTREGTTLGTVDYMSPEQSRGEDVDRRSDIWSLGAVLYAMLTGRTPFRGEYEQAVIYSILNESPEPVTAVRTGVPMELERIVDRCLAKDPAERYQTAGDLTADLRRIKRTLSERSSLQAAPASRSAGARSARWLPWVFALAVIVILALVFIPRYLPKPDAPSGEHALDRRKMLVVLPFENLGSPEDEYFADGITEEITSRLAVLRGLGVVSRTSAILYKNTDKTIRQIGEELNVDYVLEGTVRWEKISDGESRVRVTPQLIRVSDDTHIWADRYDERFEGIFDIQSRIAERVADKLDVTLSLSERSALETKSTENMIAYQVYLKGLDYVRFPHSPEDNYLKAQQIFEQAVRLDPEFTLAYLRLADAHRSLYFYGYDRTAKRLALAKDAIDRAIELEPDLPEVHLEIGYYYYHGHLDYDKALEEYSIALRDLPNNTDLLAEIAYIWRRQGLFDQAIANLEQAFSINPRDAVVAIELALTCLMVRKYEEGIHYCDISMEIVPESQWSYMIKALGYWCWTGDLEKSRAELEKNPVKRSQGTIWVWFWQEIYERNYQGALERLSMISGDAIEIQSHYYPMGSLEGIVYYCMNDSVRARTSFESSLTLLETVVKERPEDPRVYSVLGVTYAGLGRREEAIRAGNHAVELYPISKDALLGTNRIMDLVMMYALLGEYDAALENIEHLLSIQSNHSIAYFNLWPILDPVRETPGYQRLVRLYSDGDS